MVSGKKWREYRKNVCVLEESLPSPIHGAILQFFVILWQSSARVRRTGLTVTVRRIDTIHPRDVWFRALHDNSTYEWKIGADPRTFTAREFSLYIDVPGDILVRLITTRNTIYQACFPDDTGRDTFYRTIHIAKYSQIAPIYGKYLGHDDQNPTLENTVEIKSPQPAGVYSGVYGLPEGCLKLIDPPLASDFFESWRHGVILDKYINCFEPQGVATISQDNRRSMSIIRSGQA